MTAARWPGERFRLKTDDAVLADLRERLQRTRFPQSQAGPDWRTGTPLSYAVRLRDYWLYEFDWRQWEARINSFEQRMVEIDGHRIHVIVEQGSGDNPLPLVMSHGWPGSFIEYLDLIGMLAHPERHGGRAEDAFTVVIPSLLGYGLSPAPAAPVSLARMAELWAKLMTQEFNFDRYVAHGSDFGSVVTANLALDHPERLQAFHITSAGVIPAITADAPLTAEEQAWQQRFQQRFYPESGYQFVQGTKPQSLAYGHTDSPMALACWIIEKFHGWTTPGSTEDPPFSMDALLANVMLYWLNGAVAPMWIYMLLVELQPLEAGRKATVPGGFLLTPNDLLTPPPRSWLDRSFEVAHYRLAGLGHFPGLDSPGLLVDELQTFLRPMDKRSAAD